MSLEDFKRYADIAIDVLDQSHVGFVGGEPTAHPNLVSMMEYVLYEKNRPVALFTNLLGPEDTIEGITNILSGPKKDDVTIIWNNSEFYEQFSERQQKITLAAATKLSNLTSKILFSWTYRKGSKASPFVDISRITGIDKIRFAFNVSEMHELILPDTVDELISELEIVNSSDIMLTNDGCGFIPPPPHIKLRQYLKIMSYFNNYNRCPGSALDVLTDGRVIPCLPYFDETKDLFLTDVLSFDHLNELIKHHYGAQAQKTPYKGGLCPAHYQREKPTQQQVVNFFKS